MSTFLEDYTEVVRRMHVRETEAGWFERKMLGFVAAGIARFIRRRSCEYPADRPALLVLADRADAIAARCHSRHPPTGEA